MVRKATILEMVEVYELIKKYHPEYDPYDLFDLVYFFIRDPYHHILIPLGSKIDKLLLVEEVLDDVTEIHIYSEKETRGKEVLKFIEDCKEWGRNYTNINKVYNCVDKTNRPLKLLMRYMGSKKYVEHDDYIYYVTNIRS